MNSAVLPYKHLLSIYNRMISEQPWSKEVKWNPFSMIKIQWPKTYQKNENSLASVEIVLNGEKTVVGPNDVLEIMKKEHKINRLEFEVKPWIRDDKTGGITLKLNTMDLSVL